MSNKNKGKVFCAMSGGVDSSVAAHLLKKHGYDVVGVFMRCFNLDGCQDLDSEDARRVAEKIGIPFYVWDFESEYKARVVDYMVEGYARGETPNPDVMCNREIKFGIFYDRARAMGADYVATGHYARVGLVASWNQNSFVPATKLSSLSPRRLFAKSEETKLAEAPRRSSKQIDHTLLIGRDKNKDQSYFLWTLTQDKLAHCIFPVGDCLKSEVREIARGAGLPTAEKKDSQGICFLGRVTLQDFLSDYLPVREGVAISPKGKVVGSHEGAHFYTIGQRRIASGDWKYATGDGNRKPLFVVDKDIRANTITVAGGGDHQAFYRKEIYLRDVNILNKQKTINEEQDIFARIRYRQPLQRSTLKIQNLKFRIFFESRQKAVALGQSAVWYSETGELLGGGVIDVAK